MSLVSVVIFDLDGTLYEDTEHFDYLAEQYRQRVPAHRQDDYARDYQAIAAGEHPLAIGRVYDVSRDVVLEVNRRLAVQAGWQWDGTPVPATTLAATYLAPIEPDMEAMLSIGDGWWPPQACALHHGATDTRGAFLATKEFVASDAFTLQPIPGLAGALERMRDNGKCLVLATNSHQEDTERLLQRLGLEGYWHALYPDCNKPKRTREVFSAIAARFGAGGRAVLSVGDNFLNEIAPAEDLGFQTLFIDPLGVTRYEYDGPRVQRLGEVLDQFR